MPCQYQNKLHCDKCSFVVYKDCENFRKSHVRYLLNNIIPFKRETVSLPHNFKVGVSIYENKAKSGAALVSLSTQAPVLSFTTDQVLTIVLNDPEYFPERNSVVYINAKNKPRTESTESIICSFIDRCTMHGSYVFVYAPALTGMQFKEYPKIQ